MSRLGLAITLVVVAASVGIWPAGAGADTLTLQNFTDQADSVQQDFHNPCIFTGSECVHQPDLGTPISNDTAGGTLTSFGSNNHIDANDAFDWAAGQASSVPGVCGQDPCTDPILAIIQYDVNALTSATGSNVWNVGIDVNQTGGSAGINLYFCVDFGADGSCEYTFGTIADPLLVPQSLTGSGWADASLSSIDASTHAGEQVQFRLYYTGNDDGNEQFILFAGETQPVPEPGTLLLVGSGLIGMGAYGRRHLAKYFGARLAS